MNTYPSVEYLRPGRMVEMARDPGLALIPVSPAFEWHSYHLPLGTDAIIAEEVAARLAQRFGAAWFRVLSLGLDSVRDQAFKLSQGLDPAAHVFGMCFPTVPLASEYITIPAMRAQVEARLQAVKGSGFRCAALVNHHGGEGQVALLQDLAAAWTTPSFRVGFLATAAGPDFRPPPGTGASFHVGGHAGLAETLKLMAFRPDLVELSALPEGPLRAGELGILHSEPVIPAAFNPRQARAEWARAWGDHVMERLAAQVRSLLDSAPAPAP